MIAACVDVRNPAAERAERTTTVDCREECGREPRWTDVAHSNARGWGHCGDVV